MKKNVFVLLALFLCFEFLSACKPFLNTVLFDFKLTEVVRSENAESKIGNFYYNPFLMEDELIEVVTIPYEKGVKFSIKNKSNKTIKISWDDSSFIDADGNSDRIVNDTIRLLDKDRSIPYSVIPANSNFTCDLTPSSKIYYSDGWRIDPLIILPGLIRENELSDIKLAYEGKTVRVILNIISGAETYEYTFAYKVSNIRFKDKVENSQSSSENYLQK